MVGMRRGWGLGALVLLLGACDSGSARGPSGGGGGVKPRLDAGVVVNGADASEPVDTDGGSVSDDAGETLPQPDSGPLTGPDSGTPPADGGTTPPGDGGTPTGLSVGAACNGPAACPGGTCLTGMPAWWDEPFSGGYCTLENCSSANNPCPTGSECFYTDQARQNTTCLQSCTSNAQCRTGYECFEPGACLPSAGGGPGPSGAPVGGACTQNSDCAGGANARCVTNNFPGGYCIIVDCQTGACPTGSSCYIIDNQNNTACLADCARRADCRPMYACHDPGVCFPACTANSCDAGEVCGPEGVCVNAPCTPGSCPSGQVCDTNSGQCVVNLGTPPPGPVPSCTPAAPAICQGTEAHCGELLPFLPRTGPGWWDYPINGETANNQYRSFARRDVIMLVQYATSMVECQSANWTFGNRQPLGLGDMSEGNGAIPGTSVGQPGHPPGTHEFGRDMDIAYYQLQAADNRLRSVCPHTQNGQDQYRCVAPPTDLDVWRSALFVGHLHANTRLRVVGLDGQVGPLVESAMQQLCSGGWLTGSVCTTNGRKTTYEVTDMGRGWFRFHHHHLHMSIRPVGAAVVPAWDERMCKAVDCRPMPDHHHDDHIEVIERVRVLPRFEGLPPLMSGE